MARRISIIIEKCMGCHTCELACAIAHSESGDIEKMLAAGENPGYRVSVESYRGRAVPVNCRHCDEPACVPACPTGAVHRDAPGKPVLVDQERCIGCSMCVQACPFGMMSMSTEGNGALKCDLCIERLAQDMQPACVDSCPSHALRFEEEEAFNREKRRIAAQRMAEAQDLAERSVEGISGA